MISICNLAAYLGSQYRYDQPALLCLIKTKNILQSLLYDCCLVHVYIVLTSLVPRLPSCFRLDAKNVFFRIKPKKAGKPGNEAKY